jgi:hypothetical protein
VSRDTLDGVAHARAGPEAEIDGAGGERLLQLAVTPKGGDFGIKADRFPDALLDAQLESREWKGRVDRFADADFLQLLRRDHCRHAGQIGDAGREQGQNIAPACSHSPFPLG